MKARALVMGDEIVQSARPLALRPKDAARELAISERLLWEWTRSEGLPHVRLGNVVLYPVDGLRRWLDDRSITVFGGSDVSA